MNYYISDLHFMHKNVTNEGSNFDNRPYNTLDEMHEDMITKWNAKVHNNDDVYLLGDICWKENEEGIQLISRLKGRLHAIKGNHCKFKDERYRRLFTEIVDYKEIHDNSDGGSTKVVLSHYPILMWNGQHRGAIHLYGHVHDSTDEYIYQDALSNLNRYYRERDGERYNPFFAFNVGCMHWNYEPVTLAEIIEGSVEKC